MSRETKIGIFTLVTIALSVWGFKYIKGKNILTTAQWFYAEYENINYLQPSSPVYHLGNQVGMITDIYPNPDNVNLIVVEFEVEKFLKVPKSTIANIMNTSFMGDKGIVLEIKENCDGNCAQRGDRLEGRMVGMVGSMLPVEDLKGHLDMTIEGLKSISGELDSMMNDSNGTVGKMLANLGQTFENMKITTSLLNQELREKGKINGILTNVEDLTQSIDKRKLDTLMGNATAFSSNLKAVDLEKLAASTDQTFQKAQATMTKLNATMEKADQSLVELNAILEKINKGEGTLGKIAKDEALYNELKEAAAKTSALMDDLKNHPYRYVPLKKKKKVEKYDKQIEAEKNKTGNGG